MCIPVALVTMKGILQIGGIGHDIVKSLILVGV